LHYLLSGTCLGNGQTDTEDGVGTELGLVGSTIKFVKECVDLGLVLDIDTLLDQGRGDDGVHILDGLGDTLTTPLLLVAIPKLARFVLSCILGYYLLWSGTSGVFRNEPVEAPEGTMARWRPVSVTTSTSTVGLPRESYT
jgi:hypothetical protein